MVVYFRTLIVATKCYYSMLHLLLFISGIKMSRRPSYNILFSPLP